MRGIFKTLKSLDSAMINTNQNIEKPELCVNSCSLFIYLKTTILIAWFKELCYVNQTTEDSALSNNLIYYVLCETRCSNNECKVQSAECRCFNNRMKYRMQTSNLGNTNYSREKTQTQICFYLVEFCHQT